MQMDWGLIVVLLCVSIPVLVVFGLYFWSNRNDKKEAASGTRFPGTQLDIAILVLGLLFLLVLVKWASETFFR